MPETDTSEKYEKINESWLEAFEYSMENFPEETIFMETAVSGQKEDFSCGTSVVGDIIQTVTGNEVDEQILIDKATAKIEALGGDISEWGTTPAVLIELLREANIEFEVKESDDSYTNEQTLATAKTWLDEQLMSRHICLIGIQSTPDYWYRDKKTDEIITGSDRDFDDEWKVVDPSRYEIVHTDYDAWIDRNKPPTMHTEGKNLKSARTGIEANGHYIVVVGKMMVGEKSYYITADPIYYSYHQYRNIGNRKYWGLRFIQDTQLIKNWHDEESDGTKSYQQAISVPFPITQ